MKRLLIDVSSLLWQSLLAGKDAEHGRVVFHEGKDVYVNSWSYGFECAANHLLPVFRELELTPVDAIFVVEGAHSKARRTAIYAGYKGGRNSRPPEAYVQFNLCKEKLTETFLALGSQVVQQDGAEGDDCLAYLCKHLDGDKVILTTDGDMTTLVGEHVALWQKGMLTSENKYGPFPPRFVPVYKALCGDGSEYKGAAGFGPKAFLDMLVAFGNGGLAGLEGMMKRKKLHELQDDVASFKPFQKVINSAEHVYESYQCALLHDEWCNTLRQPLKWQAGMVKPATDPRFKHWGQQVRLVTSDTYAAALEFFKSKMAESRIVALDIETSTPDESDEWLQRRDKATNVDVFGSQLTGMGLTFGRNNQYTFYMPCAHTETKNLTTDQIKAVVEAIPQTTPIIIQNFSFEGPILWELWGEAWKDNGWHGFLPNVIDTKILANYVDENVSSGLKQGSLLYLNYEQTSYAEVTEGKKMNALSGQHVLSYGTDDTICTAALFNFFRIRTELEGTWKLINEIEIKPAYLTAYAFTQGTNFSLARMKELEKADAEIYAKAWETLREWLIERGWEGTVTPQYTELTAAAIKEACQIVLGLELETRVRTPSKLAKLVELLEHEDAPLLAQYIEWEKLDQINDLVKSRFTGEPRFDLNSPKQFKNLLYNHLNLPVRLVNNCTQLERTHNRPLADAVYKHKKIANGSQSVELTDEDKELLKGKARSDDTAIDFALKFDSPGNKVLLAVQTMKSCLTKAQLYYKPYSEIRHWKDNKIHAQINQCATVTRRWSSSSPNLQQLPKTKGVVFRECFTPHKRGAVICSVDYSGQELRLQAGLSGDKEMLSCYIGDNLRDIHSITASSAMKVVWSSTVYDGLMELVDGNLEEYERFLALLHSGDKWVASTAKNLRNLAKGVNFGSSYGCEAPKMQEILITDLLTATVMLEAKLKKFSGYEEWKERVEAEAKERGYVTTLLGGRRHLQTAMTSDDKWLQGSAARQASNFMIQSAGAELCKKTLGRLWDSGIFFRLDAVFIAVIHDEVVWSVMPEDAFESIQVVWDAVSQPYTPDFPVPFLGSISLGPTFGQQIEVGEKPDRAAVQKVLDSFVAKILTTV